jgi:hypothetical protein
LRYGPGARVYGGPDAREVARRVDEHQKRKALNEDLFRKVNEQIEALNEAFTEMSGSDEFQIVCECDRVDCTERLPISASAYHAARADARVFIIAPGHGDPEVETVIERTKDYWVVRKRAGEPAETAAALAETRASRSRGDS